MNVSINGRTIIGFLVLSICLSSCIEEFTPDFNLTQSVLIVESTITDEPGEQYVRLRYSVPSGYNDSYFLSLKNAKVTVVKDGNENIDFVENEDGYYYPKIAFLGEEGHTYQLKFTSSDNKSFQSSPQELRSVRPIKSVYQKFTQDGININDNPYPGHIIYVDTEDPEGMGDNYYWSWKLYERQNVCISCEGALYYNDPLPLGHCEPNRNLQRSGTIYDYTCDGDCYDIFYSDRIEILSDQFSDGLTIKGKEIARVPLYSDHGGLMVIKQYALSLEAYEYFKLLRDQAQTTGSFADTPPAALIGNIRNTSDINDGVAGLFIVAGISKKTYWIDRSEVTDLKIRPYGLLKGRFVNPEPSTATRPPLAPCIEGDNRTRLRPDGFL